MLYYSFNTWLQEKFNERVQKVTLDADLSCPNRDGTKGTGGCIYCDYRGSGSGAAGCYPNLRAQALAGMQFLGRRYKAKKFIVYFQSFCNTYASSEQLQQMYDDVVMLPGVVGLSVATRPDCLTPEILELLASYAERMMVWLELGLQSVDNETLKRINRGHTYEEFLAGYRCARNYPVLVCLHVIIGLPGEQRTHVLATAREVSRLRPEGIKIHSLYIHKNTAMERLFTAGAYKPLEQKEFVGLACDFLELLPEDVVIQRITGDPDPRQLVAPQWALNKQETRAMICEEMDTRSSRQGCRSREVCGAHHRTLQDIGR